MKILMRLFFGLALLVLVACGPPKPTVGASVGATGPDARVGVQSGRVNAGVGTNGAYAGVDVVQTDNVRVGVGTGGVGASARVGNSPVRLGWGLGGWRIGI